MLYNGLMEYTTQPAQDQNQTQPSFNNISPNQPPQAATTGESQKYGVFKAIKDTFKAINQNILAVVAAVVIALLLGFSVILLAAAVIAFSVSKTGFSFSPQAMIIGIIIGAIVYVVASALISAFYTNFVALAINDGADRKKSDIAALFKKSLSSIVRVTIASLLLGLLIIAPFMIVIILIYMLVGANGGAAALGLLTVAYLVVSVWAFIALLRYSLVPIVALFERDIAITKTFSRSKHLLQKGGQWFLVKGFFLLLVMLILLSLFDGDKTTRGLEGSDNTLMNIVIIIVGIVVSGVMVMLYRNRRSVRG